MLSRSTYLRVGAQEAHGVVVFRNGDERAASVALADYEVQAVAGLISRITPSNERFEVFEVGSLEGVRMLEDSQLRLLGDRRTKSAHITESLSSPHVVRERIKSYMFGEMKSSFGRLSIQQLLVKDIFASGSSFSPDFFGGLIGHIHICPTIIELIRALCVSRYSIQTSRCWQVLCPSQWVGRTFGELAASWADGTDEHGLLQSHTPVVVIAMYRKDASNLFGGVSLTLPRYDTQLVESDLLTVLAAPEFASEMTSRGLLRGRANFCTAPLAGI